MRIISNQNFVFPFIFCAFHTANGESRQCGVNTAGLILSFELGINCLHGVVDVSLIFLSRHALSIVQGCDCMNLSHISNGIINLCECFKLIDNFRSNFLYILLTWVFQNPPLDYLFI